MAHQAVEVGIARLKSQLRSIHHRHNRGGGSSSSWRHRCGGRLRAPGPPPIQMTHSSWGRRRYSRRRRNNHLMLLCRTVDQRQQLAKPVGKNQRSQDFRLKGRIAAKVVAAELPKDAERLFKVEAVPGGRVGKNPVFFRKPSPVGFFYLFFYIYICPE
jgi:hypothetical protein